jgi:hypothetical protein
MTNQDYCPNPTLTHIVGILPRQKLIQNDKQEGWLVQNDKKDGLEQRDQLFAF